MRWRPVRDLFHIRDEMDRFFDEFMGRVPARGEMGEGVWSPDVDIRESENEIIVESEVPGMDQKDIKVSIKDNVLTLMGEKKQQREAKEANYHRVERTYGSFVRSFTLPTTVLPDKASASYKSGVLKITLPKSEEVKPKEIAVEVK
ncbi:MAG: Hsp20/alpha crystallin family protein [bacterium]